MKLVRSDDSFFIFSLFPYAIYNNWLGTVSFIEFGWLTFQFTLFWE